MNNKNFVVGLFVGFALLVFVSATLWLTGKQGSEPRVNYSMFFEKDVGGLMLGGPVFYLGVEVGTVTAMEIIPGNPMQVRVDAEVLKSAPVDSGTYASLAFQGITGVAVIKLNADPGVYEPLVKDGSNQFQVIKVRDTGFSAILAKAPNIVDKLDSVLEQINQILGEENREFVNEMLEDLSKVTSALASQEKVISEIPVIFQQTIEELRSGLVQVKTMLAGIEPDLSSTFANLDETTSKLASMSERLDDWTAANDTEMNAFVRDGLGQFPDLVADLRTTLREVEKLIKDLREDPSSLVYKPNEDDIYVEK